MTLASAVKPNTEATNRGMALLDRVPLGSEVLENERDIFRVSGSLLGRIIVRPSSISTISGRKIAGLGLFCW